MLSLVLGLSFGIILFCFILIALMYVLLSVAYDKALRLCGYKNSWLAWIPYIRYFACADCIPYVEEQADIIRGVNIPSGLFKLWWLLLFILPVVPGVGVVLSTIWTVLCHGFVLKRMYAHLDNLSESEESLIAYLSAWIGIIAVVKFLFYKS